MITAEGNEDDQELDGLAISAEDGHGGRSTVGQWLRAERAALVRETVVKTGRMRGVQTRYRISEDDKCPKRAEYHLFKLILCLVEGY
jgi:hypothetical protein